jgi:hypothetical protein
VRAAVRIVALAVWLAAAATSHAQTADAPPPATFTAGERWEWQHVDNRTSLALPAVTVIVVNLDGGLRMFDGTTHYPLDAWFTDDGLSASPKPWRVWPLAVGKTWMVDSDRLRPDGILVNVRQDVTVVAYEEITVPAGTFMAFKIVHRGWYRNSRHSHGELNDTYWYAPVAKADVKHIRQILGNVTTRELTSYKRAAP